jgi:hypothetical protein
MLNAIFDRPGAAGFRTGSPGILGLPLPLWVRRPASAFGAKSSEGGYLAGVAHIRIWP